MSWKKVFENGSPVRAEIVKSILLEHEIPAVVLNKQESVYKIHGYYEVLVPAGEVMKALNIVANEVRFESEG
ncbi:hypothetical protein A3SI_01746 [Nitritalea halalkaliphila LW7]|uniref:DUF2007 domain-containing protein n=1 Tax=Nitritalea halalkaliphila LW7 TaxID=1189621 RepID=I5CAA1_9BACT|nr:DUF2007 domain-containing protein [Nitritalea halalkaliphila]EIM78753.1 hypothetical protein A3SI_01746 [Nitritalea halalkaliphila LW7]